MRRKNVIMNLLAEQMKNHNDVINIDRTDGVKLYVNGRLGADASIRDRTDF